jgi:hypothetical protein
MDDRELIMRTKFMRHDIKSSPSWRRAGWLRKRIK